MPGTYGQGRSSVKRTIRLRGMNGAVKGRAWEATELLRVGRLDPLEIVLDDSSVSRYHAEMRATDRGWRVRDLGSTNGTRLNGVRLGNGQWPLRPRDLLQFGEVAVVVEAIEEQAEPQTETPAAERRHARRGHGQSRPGTRPRRAWPSTANGSPRAGEQLMALLRAGHHLGHIEKEEDLLHSILNDAVSVLDAQRGAIVLAEGPENKLKLKAIATGRNEPRAVAAGRGEAAAASSSARAWPTAASAAASRSCATASRKTPNWRWPRASPRARWRRCCACCCARRANAWACCTSTAARGRSRSRWTTCTWPTPWRPTSRPASSAPSCCASSATCSSTPSPFWPRPSSCATSTPAATPTASPPIRLLLAEKLEMSPADVDLIRIGTPLHDIGKIGIDDAILRKPDKLTPEEFEDMKLHTVKGAEIIAHRARTCGRSCRSCARTTSAGTAGATPTAWAARRFIRWRAWSAWPTPSTP